MTLSLHHYHFIALSTYMSISHPVSVSLFLCVSPVSVPVCVSSLCPCPCLQSLSPVTVYSLCLCLFVSVPGSVSRLCIYVSVTMPLSLCPCVYVSIPTSLSLRLFLCFSLCLQFLALSRLCLYPRM